MNISTPLKKNKQHKPELSYYSEHIKESKI